jgi:16S rRNA (cytosine1402-N4)-methyltransferase
MIHKTVFLEQLVNEINYSNSKVVVDFTLGAGGHSLKVLEKLSDGVLICFDLSFEAIDNFVKELVKKGFKTEEEKEKVFFLKKAEVRVVLVNQNFTELQNILKQLQINSIDAAFADLGWSSDELTQIEGLSYETDIEAFLDMRFDNTLGVTAADLLNGLGRGELSKMFEKYADVYGKSNQNLVSEVIGFRKKGQISKVRDLKLIIDRSFKFKVGNRFQKSEVYKTYSRVFQALRIAVNSELSNLQTLLESSFDLLNKNGVMGVITFHSGEDKVVAPFLQSKLENKTIEILTQKGEEMFTRPSVDEIKENIRARSAKLYKYKKL